MCGYAAKGLWIDMLNLMMISPMIGYLVGPDKKPMTVATVAKLTGGAVDEVEKLMQELRTNRVFSVDRKGRIFSRRMKAEEDREKIGRESANIRYKNQERNQGGTFGPTVTPTQKNGANSNSKNSKKERGSQTGRASVFGSQDARGARQSKTPWTLDQKREFGWKAVAEALPERGWEIVDAAANGNSDARRVCKAKAKAIGVTWYDGKPEVKGAK